MSSLKQTNLVLDHINTLMPTCIDGRLEQIMLEFACNLENLRVAQENEEFDRIAFAIV